MGKILNSYPGVTAKGKIFEKKSIKTTITGMERILYCATARGAKRKAASLKVKLCQHLSAKIC